MQSLHADNNEQQGELQFEERECLRDRQKSLGAQGLFQHENWRQTSRPKPDKQESKHSENLMEHNQRIDAPDN